MRYGRPDDDVDPTAVPGLNSLGEDVVTDLLNEGRLVHIPQGWTPIHAHEPSDEAYFLIEGCVEVVDGHDTLANVCRGEFVGEMGLVNTTLRSARVTITDPVVAIAWPGPVFQRLRQRHPDFDAMVSLVAAERTRRNQGSPPGK